MRERITSQKSSRVNRWSVPGDFVQEALHIADAEVVRPNGADADDVRAGVNKCQAG